MSKVGFEPTRTSPPASKDGAFYQFRHLLIIWGDVWDSNPWPSEPQSDVLANWTNNTIFSGTEKNRTFIARSSSECLDQLGYCSIFYKYTIFFRTANKNRTCNWTLWEFRDKPFHHGGIRASRENRTLVFRVEVWHNKPLYDTRIYVVLSGLEPEIFCSKNRRVANSTTGQWWWAYGLVYRTSPFKLFTNPGCGEAHHLVGREGLEPPMLCLKTFDLQSKPFAATVTYPNIEK